MLLIVVSNLLIPWSSKIPSWVLHFWVMWACSKKKEPNKCRTYPTFKFSLRITQHLSHKMARMRKTKIWGPKRAKDILCRLSTRYRRPHKWLSLIKMEIIWFKVIKLRIYKQKAHSDKLFSILINRHLEFKKVATRSLLFSLARMTNIKSKKKLISVRKVWYLMWLMM